jgi:hypothetical protein
MGKSNSVDLGRKQPFPVFRGRHKPYNFNVNFIKFYAFFV